MDTNRSLNELIWSIFETYTTKPNNRAKMKMGPEEIQIVLNSRHWCGNGFRPPKLERNLTLPSIFFNILITAVKNSSFFTG